MSNMQLNKSQQQAVHTIEGAVMVLAGPGTGKTEVLASRIAHILQNTDTPPEMILALTFTDSGVATMRKRLVKNIGPTANRIHVTTYHGFCLELITRYRDELDIKFFGKVAPIDPIKSTYILDKLIADLPYSNPMKKSSYYLGDVRSTIEELKRSNIGPDELGKQMQNNLAEIELSKSIITPIFGDRPRISKALVAKMADLLVQLKVLGPYGQLAATDLSAAFASDDTKDITIWKRNWIDPLGQQLAGQVDCQKLASLAAIYQKYVDQVQQLEHLDYTDMINMGIHILQNDPVALAAVQESYLYYLLDEYQDTSPVQAELVRILADNPSAEGNPNIMIVGDDDQSIYQFQGASSDNMKHFADGYPALETISLTTNYRSTDQIIAAANSHAGSNIDQRLKTITTEGTGTKTAKIQEHVFGSTESQYAWIAIQCKKLIKSGIPAHQIAVLSPKHSLLRPIASILDSYSVPLSYERSYDLTEEDIIRDILAAARLVVAVKSDDYHTLQSAWLAYLSRPYLQLDPVTIWKAVESVKNSKNITEHYLELFPDQARYIISLVTNTSKISLAMLIEMLVGIHPVGESISGILDYYFTSKPHDIIYYQNLSSLHALRDRISSYQNNSDDYLVTILELVDLSESTGQSINNHFLTSETGVQLMSAHKSKGMEFHVVIMADCNEKVWGSSVRSRSNNIRLTADLKYIRYGQKYGEKPRLFYVAITRAAEQLYFCRSNTTNGGKPQDRLLYLDALDLESIEHTETTDVLTTFTAQKERIHNSDAREYIKAKFADYRLNATHLNTIMGPKGGVNIWLDKHLLQLPTAPSPSSEYGSALHDTIYECKDSQINIQAVWKKHIYARRVSAHEKKLLYKKGLLTLDYLQKSPDIIWPPNSTHEKAVKLILPSGIPIGGRLDMLELDSAAKTIVVVDYKSGRVPKSWTDSNYKDKLTDYRRQLRFYQLLLTHSPEYRQYKVIGGKLIFLDDPDLKTLYLELDMQTTEQITTEVEETWKQLKQFISGD
jgi:DNA helicase II / ATP-dependent DNA helicase PcrA